MKLIFEIFPIILFFIAYRLRDIYFATSVIMVTTMLQIGYLIIRKRKVDATLWLSFIFLLLFGGTTLWSRNEAFIKWKPTIIYLLLGLFLVISEYFGKKPLQSVIGNKLNVSDLIWRRLSFSWALFFISLAVLNMSVAYYFSTSIWVSYKLFGNTSLIVLFILIQGIFLTKKKR